MWIVKARGTRHLLILIHYLQDSMFIRKNAGALIISIRVTQVFIARVPGICNFHICKESVAAGVSNELTSNDDFIV